MRHPHAERAENRGEGNGMKGFIYRLAVAIKDAGERWKCYPLIRFGLAVKDLV
jgi:hypothetical protein